MAWKVIIVSICLLLEAGLAFAGNLCPDRANSLEAFKDCMVPMRGEVGVVYRGTLADYYGETGGHYAKAMVDGQPVAPSYSNVYPYPAATGIPAPVWQPMASVAASKAYQGNPHATFWTWWTVDALSRYPYRW